MFMTKKKLLIWIRIHYSCEEITWVNLSKTRPPLLKSQNGRPAIREI